MSIGLAMMKNVDQVAKCQPGQNGQLAAFSVEVASQPELERW
jgi:hypothetical protein